MQFANGHHDVAVYLKAMLSKGLKEAPRSGEGNLAAVAVKEACAGFILEGTDLRRDSGLGDAQLFRCARKAFQSAYFQESSQLLEIHAINSPHVVVGSWDCEDVVYRAYNLKVLEMPA